MMAAYLKGCCWVPAMRYRSSRIECARRRHVEIDGLFHGPNWVPRVTFAHEVKAFSAQPRWVTEWLYSAVRALLAERADCWCGSTVANHSYASGGCAYRPPASAPQVL